jgi:hypothetical protein
MRVYWQESILPPDQLAGAASSSLRQPLEHHCRNHEDPRDGEDVNAPALVIGHVGSFAFRGRPLGTATTRLDASLPISVIGEPGYLVWHQSLASRRDLNRVGFMSGPLTMK